MMKHMLLAIIRHGTHSLLSTVWKLIELEECLCVCVYLNTFPLTLRSGIRHHCLMDKKQHRSRSTLAQQHEERASETRKNAAQNRSFYVSALPMPICDVQNDK